MLASIVGGSCWIVLLVVTWVVARMVRQLGGLGQVLGNPPQRHLGTSVARIGRRVRVRCEAVNSARAQRSLTVPGPSVIVVVDPKCVASKRIVKELWSWLDRIECPLPFTWIVAAAGPAARRFASETNLEAAVVIKAKHSRRAGVDVAPIAIYCDQAGKVTHLAQIADAASIASFMTGCPSSALRRWFNDATRVIQSNTPIIVTNRRMSRQVVRSKSTESMTFAEVNRS